MADQRFPDSERGTANRGASPVPNKPQPNGSGARGKGVIFLLTAEGHARYLMQSSAAEQPTDKDRQTGQAVFENSEAFAANFNALLRRQRGLDYDPLEIRYFTSLQDLLLATPGGDVDGGRWAAAAIVTHSTSRAKQSGSKMVGGFWVTPDGVFSDDLFEFAGSENSEFSVLRERFDPTGTLNIYVCSGTGTDLELACAMRAFFGLGGNVRMPTKSLQIRQGGVIYAKAGEGKYRPANDGGFRTISKAQCAGF